jgi:regulator of protease activity HflC (stomatin/prohibitin superfamily)
MLDMYTIILAVLCAFAYASTVIVPEGHVALVKRLGKYNRTIPPGLNFVIFGLENLVYTNWNRKVVVGNEIKREKICMCYIPFGMELSFDPPPYKVTTSDKISISIDVLATYRIVDPSIAVFSVDDLYNQFQSILETILVSECSGKTTEVISATESFGREIVSKIKTIASDWGIEILKIKVQNISYPYEVESSNIKSMVAKKEADTTIQNEATLLKASMLRVERESKIKMEEMERQIALEKLKIEAEAQRMKIEADAKFYKKKMEFESEYLPFVEKKKMMDGLELEFIKQLQKEQVGKEYLCAKLYASAFSELAKSNNKLVIMPSDAIKTMGNMGMMYSIQAIDERNK